MTASIAWRSGITVVPPRHALRGKVVPPGSKSNTNRALLLAALAKGASRLTGALKSDDTAFMAAALRGMGVLVEEPDETGFIVTGTGRLAAPNWPLAPGNAGAATRFLTAAAAIVEGEVVLTGRSIGARGYVDLTLSAMAAFGAQVEDIGTAGWRVAPTGYRAADFAVEPDASAATYLWAAEVLTGGTIDLGFAPDASGQPDARAYSLIPGL